MPFCWRYNRRGKAPHSRASSARNPVVAGGAARALMLVDETVCARADPLVGCSKLGFWSWLSTCANSLCRFRDRAHAIRAGCHERPDGPCRDSQQLRDHDYTFRLGRVTRPGQGVSVEKNRTYASRRRAYSSCHHGWRAPPEANFFRARSLATIDTLPNWPQTHGLELAQNRPFTGSSFYVL